MVYSPKKNSTVLVCGASGFIGSAVVNYFLDAGCEVVGVMRKDSDVYTCKDRFKKILIDDNFSLEKSMEKLGGDGFIDAVVWAQGLNFNDSISKFDLKSHLKMYEANVTFVLTSLNCLKQYGFLAQKSRLCIVSSIWQSIARQDKLSYCVTKSALHGLVLSLSIDLGLEGHLINAVLPGVLDSSMTRNNLTHSQIEEIEKATPLKSLPHLDDLLGLIGYLCSKNNTGVTGQFISVDRGYSNARII